MNAEQSLSAHFEGLGIPQDAASWLLDVWQVVQTFDDMADGDEVARADVDKALWSCLVGLQSNPFHVQHGAALVPVLALQILKWQASDDAERAGRADARSFVWRAGFYDLALMVLCLSRGPDMARARAADVMRLYGESLTDYLKEFGNA